MSTFDLPWNKFVGFSLFTFEEDLIYDKIINPKSSYSTVYHIIDTSLKTREELKKSNKLTLINEIFRVDYEIFFNLILAFMFHSDVKTEEAQQLIEVIKKRLIEQIEEYGSIDKMETSAQTALVKKLGKLICERAANQIKYDYYKSRKTLKPTKPSTAGAAPEKKEITTTTKSPTSAATTPATFSKPTTTAVPTTPSKPTPTTSARPKVSVSPTKTLEEVEELLKFIGLKEEVKKDIKPLEVKQEMTRQLLEETKKESIRRLLSSIIKGLSPKTGVCFVAKSPSGALDLTTFGMSEKHATFVLTILSKYPEIVKQTLEQESEEKTLDAGDGVVILEDTESGMLVSITANKDEIPIIAKRLKVVKSMIDEFLKTSI